MVHEVGLIGEKQTYPQLLFLWIKPKFGKMRLARIFGKRPHREHWPQHALDAGLFHRPEVATVERF